MSSQESESLELLPETPVANKPRGIFYRQFNDAANIGCIPCPLLILRQVMGAISRLKIYLAAVLVFYCVLLGAGAIYQAVASHQDDKAFPPPGRLIDMGGYSLHINCQGTRQPDAPLVVLEGGLGAPSFMWALVQPEIAKHTRVCSYDRAGYGWSTLNSRDAPTADHLAEELHSLLQKARENPPYILVGHSYGSIIIRMFGGYYGSELAGVIFIDPRHEDFFNRMPPDYLQIDKRNLRSARILKFVTPFGFTRIAGNAGLLDAFERYLAPLSPNVEPAAWARMIYNPRHWAASLAEREASETSYQQVRTINLPQSLPLVVLTAANGIDAWRPPGYQPDAHAQQIWLEMQKEQSELTSAGQWIMIDDSGHYMYFDQPDAIVEAVLKMLAN